jgi:hypothetical protein
MIFGKKLTVIATVLLSCCTGTFAADTSGTILGTVKDATGCLVPRGTATLTNKATGVKRTSQADGQGAFAFPVVPVGTYELVFLLFVGSAKTRVARQNRSRVVR